MHFRMAKLKESGVLDVLWKKWHKTRNSTMCVTNRHVNPISMKVVGGGFVILCVGVVMATMVLVWERLKGANMRQLTGIKEGNILYVNIVIQLHS